MLYTSMHGIEKDLVIYIIQERRVGNSSFVSKKKEYMSHNRGDLKENGTVDVPFMHLDRQSIEKWKKSLLT